MHTRLALALVVGLACTGVGGRADIVLDMDPSTPGIFETSVSVAPGSPFSVAAFYVPGAMGPIAFDAVGLNLAYGFPLGDTSTVAPAPYLAGFGGIMGPLPAAFDTVTGAPSPPGFLLASAFAPPPFPGPSFGGAGFYDPFGTYFGGITFLSPFPVNLMGWDLVASATPGVVTLSLSGIFSPFVFVPPGTPGFLPFLGGPFPGGDPLYDSGTGLTLFEPIGGPYLVVIVPEPSAVALLVLGALGAALRRRATRCA